ncbi:MAG TPA: protein-glutamate O-methyltransferase CheR [Falsiroseomonas sp.]|jgi:chemotaxis protein methyltransferase CheR|nr:protein-glutamate O-methyltransferase CheR [Falsiroseomonas sp.]
MGGEHQVIAARAPRLGSEDAFRRLKDLIHERTGHFYYEDKDALLQERVARRLRATDAGSPAAYVDLLSEPVAGEAEWVALAAEITIGETFFFRYAEQFAALEKTILPAIIAGNRESRRIRIWSAGCSNGAEPYSVAILLRRLLGEEIADWHIAILGTDLNEAALSAARRAQFGSWALRTLPRSERERDFLAAPGGRLWALKPHHRGMVRFERHNLMQLLDGTSPLQIAEFDLILCRNVLIYFHPEALPRMVRALGERLAASGWLLVGHAEANLVPAAPLATVELPGTLAYRRAPLGTEPEIANATARPTLAFDPPAAPSAAALPQPATPMKAPPLASGPPTSRQPPAGDPDALASVRRLADLGKLEEARLICHAGLQRDFADAGLHYYDGLIASALGEREEAERGFRRALYLRKDFIMAHHQLGLLLADAGRGAEGFRAVATALRLALAMPDGTLLAEGDGLTAATFRVVARLRLASPPPAR